MPEWWINETSKRSSYLVISGKFLHLQNKIYLSFYFETSKYKLWNSLWFHLYEVEFIPILCVVFYLRIKIFTFYFIFSSLNAFLYVHVLFRPLLRLTPIFPEVQMLRHSCRMKFLILSAHGVTMILHRHCLALARLYFELSTWVVDNPDVDDVPRMQTLQINRVRKYSSKIYSEIFHSGRIAPPNTTKMWPLMILSEELW